MDLTSDAAQAQTSKEGVNPRNLVYRRLRHLRLAFWFVTGIIGFLQIWLRDYIMFSDTLSYLDSGDMLWRGDFANAFTDHWSPGLPFLLGLALKILHPVGLWEVAVVKLVDFQLLFLRSVALTVLLTKFAVTMRGARFPNILQYSC